jgi:Zn-dependent protease/CBS domain-containing protein
MFGKQVTLFQLLGFKVKVDVSWAFLALLIAWSLAQGLFPALYEGLPAVVYWWMGIAGVVGLFLSIVFHELSHSLVARQYGLPIRGITLFIFGGVAEMEEEPVSPRAEFLMAIAGPIASAVLALAFYGLAAAGQALEVSEPVIAVARYLAFLNILLAGFNVVPAFPLDGGRVLRAALWHWKKDLRQATRIASRIGAGFGLLLIGLGILNALTGNFVGGIWWFLIGLFLRGAATGSYYQLMARRALEGEPVRRFMSDRPVTVSPTVTVRELVEDYVYKHYFDMFPVTKDSQLIGCVNTRQIKEEPREKWDYLTVGQIASPCSADNTVTADEDAARVLSRMQRSGNSRLMVTEDGRLVGVIALKDMLNLIALKMDLETND